MSEQKSIETSQFNWLVISHTTVESRYFVSAPSYEIARKIVAGRESPSAIWSIQKAPNQN